MNIDTGCDQCYAIHIYLDCLASKFLDDVHQSSTGTGTKNPGTISSVGNPSNSDAQFFVCVV